ncbi:TonB-dependent Receptor Plug Domain [Paracoccus aminovorans]|uniref:TonB-dependent Receptor Plug Domain n=1 Tax=Paracoccus aminovorans TaxID=34004 RepID=A0A1I2ZX59_9RHOB|nr:TonB-dependent siderophore receptor, truncated [Paracoccus aminovorans]SFH42427.1 TonB-dependent Receptor Plug Domain [Paracoccus aminovorans]
MTYLTSAPAAAARALALSTGLVATRALMLGTALGAVIALPVLAQARDYAIGPGRLSDVLARYAADSGVQLVYQPSALAGLRSAGLRGSYTVEQGFSVLLAGSGYRLQQAAPGSYVLVPPAVQGAAAQPGDGAVVLDTVTLRGGGATTEGSGSYAAESASIARGAESLKEVPQSVTVITDQAIKDQNLTMMSDAMAKAPGIVATTDGMGNPEFRSRGFVIDNYQIDNMVTRIPRPSGRISIWRSMTGSRFCAAPRGCSRPPESRAAPSTWRASGRRTRCARRCRWPMAAGTTAASRPTSAVPSASTAGCGAA